MMNFICTPLQPQRVGLENRMCVVWWLVWWSALMSVCVCLAEETASLADKQPWGNRQRRSFQKWALTDSTVWGVPVVPVLGILYAFFPDFYNHRKQLLLLLSLMHCYRWGSRGRHKDVATFPRPHRSHNRIMFNPEVVFLPQNHPGSNLHKIHLWSYIPLKLNYQFFLNTCLWKSHFSLVNRKKKPHRLLLLVKRMLEWENQD